MQHIPHTDLYDAQRWAEQAAADADAELAYQRMCDDATHFAAQAAADAEAERHDHRDVVVDTDLF